MTGTRAGAMSERLRVTGGTDSVRWCAENSAPDVWPAGEIMMKRLICLMVGLVLLTGQGPVSYTHLTLPTTPYV